MLFRSLLANLVIVYIDTTHAEVLYGQSANRWGQLTWIFAQPAVLGFALPLLGVLGDAAHVAARTRPARYGVSLGAIGAAGALTFGAYAQTIFNPDLVHVVNPAVLGLGGIWLAKTKGYPLVASYHTHLPKYLEHYGMGIDRKSTRLNSSH